ncbi:putative transmembrane protein 244 [Styela clava]
MAAESDDENEGRTCSPELKRSNILILQNIGVCLFTFYCIYFAMSALMHGVFHVESTFDGRQPFNFVAMSNLDFSTGSVESVACFLAMELTYFCTTLLISFYLLSRVWDYAITITFVHLILSCAVMMALPTTWQWWCSIGIGTLWMITMGECISFFLRRKKARRAIGNSLVLPSSNNDNKS